jgi:mannose-1-phosphate guanylyltransferase
MGFHVLVLAGGSGTRLWPLSRSATPKHLLPLAADGRTLLHAAVERVRDLGDSCRVVTASSQADACRRDLQDLGPRASAVIAEPVARGTGPALGLAIGLVAREDPDALIATVHADHRVGDSAAYRAALIASAGWAATTNGLATVGLTPTRPATGFGYIELGARRAGGPVSPSKSTPGDVVRQAAELEAFEAVRFVEKPSLETARSYAGAGRHVWNLGLFAWPAAVFLAELTAANPRLAQALEGIVDATLASRSDEASRSYAALASVPVEPLVLERTSQLTVVRAAFSWSDLGSWSDLHESRVESGEADAAGNLVDGAGIAVDSRDCTVISRGGRLVTVVGADAIVVVDTPDALLVVPSDKAQLVKDAVDRLRAAGRDDVL